MAKKPPKPAKKKPGKAPKAEKAPKAKKEPKAKAPKPAKKKPTQVAQTDKFGIALLSLVLIMLIANFMVWDSVGARVDQTLFNRPTNTEYGNRISPNPEVIAYESRGVLAKRRGEVDVVVLNKGARDGVQLGDIFRSESYPSGGDEADVFVEFSVMELNDSFCRAWIILGTTWDQRGRLRLTESSIASKIKINTPVKRDWNQQEVRQLVQLPPNEDS